MKETALILILVGVATVCCHSLGNRDSRQVGSNCPTICPAVYAPVCGSNGKTYGNTCEVHVAACLYGTTLTVVKQGPCDS